MPGVIFVLEDDDSIREMMVYALSGAGYDASGYSCAEAFWDAVEENVPSLALLDIMLPGEDGLSILRRMRRTDRCRSVPVIMLTAKGSELDRVKGLDLGADDYISKPFSVMEVTARVRAVLRRGGDNADSGGVLKVGGVVLDSRRRAVSADGELSLTYKEFELLEFLMRNEGIVLSRDRLLEEVWGFDYGGESRTVDMHVKSLRRKLGRFGGLIKTVRSVGYKIGE
ncbi:MAG: response regulator transcription factor [Synergistaceae bacterium]|jgi:two-component system alkaline phosphatase synthesis response regulator PhoP|nr:response regulator transcription factor [Synergistaceae bacterium]